MLSNTQQLINGKTYAFDSSGAMLTGWQFIDGYWYYFLPGQGERVEGQWKFINNIWYYFEQNSGQMVSSTEKLVNGSFYRFDGTGAMVTGWYLESNKWYYYDKNSGAKLIGTFLKSNSMLYYLDYNSGEMLSNTERIINGNNYIFSSSGSIKLGWILENGIWYYYNINGNKATGWFFDTELKHWYYFNNKGEMLRNSYIDNYWVSDSGAWTWTFSPTYFQQGDYR